MPDISFKMLSYNIMSGCFDNYSKDAKLSDRFILLKQALCELNADFVGLIDTFKWRETFSKEDLKLSFNYKNVFSIDMDDTRVEKNIGLTVLTNLPVKKFNIIRAYNRNFIETDLGGVYVYTCYLDDLSEDTRLLEINSLLKQIKTPAIIHGDLNTFDKLDISKHSLFWNYIEEISVELFTELKPVFDSMERAEVIEVLKTNGFYDSNKTGSPTAPTKLFSRLIPNPLVRTDYILGTKDITFNNCIVERSELLDKVSDHFPLSALLIIPG